jgi:hypothetical protein
MASHAPCIFLDLSHGGEAVPKAEEWLAQSRRDAKQDETKLI